MSWVADCSENFDLKFIDEAVCKKSIKSLGCTVFFLFIFIFLCVPLDSHSTTELHP